jgi:hypothetical protein
MLNLKGTEALPMNVRSRVDKMKIEFLAPKELIEAVEMKGESVAGALSIAAIAVEESENPCPEPKKKWAGENTRVWFEYDDEWEKGEPLWCVVKWAKNRSRALRDLLSVYVDGTANVDKVFYHWNDRIMNAVTQADSLKNRAEANYR